MFVRTVILLCTFLLGSLALPTIRDESDLSVYFDTHEGQGRIVGGSVAAEGSHPWMVAMTQAGHMRHHLCGGSIISQRTVLTAAHCIIEVRWGNGVMSHINIHVGTNRFRTGGQTLSLGNVVMHENFVYEAPPQNDIGVMYTTTNIIYTQFVQPIDLSWSFVDGNLPVRVAGWGRTRQDNSGPSSDVLLELDTMTITSQLCSSAAPINAQNEVCTFHSPGHGTCTGDSGSPLVRTDSNQQVGIVSWGYPCAVGGPDVFVRVTAYRSWIERHTRHF